MQQNPKRRRSSAGPWQQTSDYREERSRSGPRGNTPPGSRRSQAATGPRYAEEEGEWQRGPEPYPAGRGDEQRFRRSPERRSAEARQSYQETRGGWRAEEDYEQRPDQRGPQRYWEPQRERGPEPQSWRGRPSEEYGGREGAEGGWETDREYYGPRHGRPEEESYPRYEREREPERRRYPQPTEPRGRRGPDEGWYGAERDTYRETEMERQRPRGSSSRETDWDDEGVRGRQEAMQRRGGDYGYAGEEGNWEPGRGRFEPGRGIQRSRRTSYGREEWGEAETGLRRRPERSREPMQARENRPAKGAKAKPSTKRLGQAKRSTPAKGQQRIKAHTSARSTGQQSKKAGASRPTGKTEKRAEACMPQAA